MGIPNFQLGIKYKEEDCINFSSPTYLSSWSTLNSAFLNFLCHSLIVIFTSKYYFKENITSNFSASSSHVTFLWELYFLISSFLASGIPSKVTEFRFFTKRSLAYFTDFIRSKSQQIRLIWKNFEVIVLYHYFDEKESGNFWLLKEFE